MPHWTVEAMQDRLVRYADLRACRTATGIENFTIIGSSVSESPEQHVHICERHGFNIGGARQPFGCLNSQHSRDAAEIFVVHSGNWRLHFGPNKEDGSLDIAPGDVASVPIHIFRGFSKLDQGKGFLWIPLGQDDPGKVTWAPAVFTAAADHGLKLARGGRLIDTSSGTYELKEGNWRQRWTTRTWLNSRRLPWNAFVPASFAQRRSCLTQTLRSQPRALPKPPSSRRCRLTPIDRVAPATTSLQAPSQAGGRMT